MFEEYGSDYKRPNLDLDKLLPAVNRSEVSKSVLDTLFQRWLTKPEVVGIAGTIGFPLSNISDAILESTTGRQAYQLSPVYHITYGTEEVVFNWADIMRKADHVGVDPLNYHQWGAFDQFNYAPPIDLKKFIDYTNYYWANPQNVPELPDYVTISRDSLQVNPWSLTNRWYTKAEVESPYLYGLSPNPADSWVGIAKQAVYPIIEFDDVELNQWSKITRVWNRRPSLTTRWATTSVDPTIAEMQDPLFTQLWELVSETTIPCANQPTSMPPTLSATLVTPTTQLTVPSYLYGQNSLVVTLAGKRVYEFYEVEVVGSQHSTQIEFTKPIVGAIEVFVGTTAISDLGRYDVQTNVAQSAALYTSNDGLRVYGVVPKNLAQYVYTGQFKRSHSQQPLFNLYDATTSEFSQVGTIWEYVDDTTKAVIRQLNKRLWISGNNEDFKFVTDLIQQSARLLTFKIVDTNTVSTIWRGKQRYEPRYVNKDRVADGELAGVSVPVGSGIWEPSPMLTTNPKRETRTTVRYSEVLPHFKSVLNAQPPSSTAVDWSLGGVIKIAHGGESHFVSSLLAKHIALPNLINFVAEQEFATHTIIEQQVLQRLVQTLSEFQHPPQQLAPELYRQIKSMAVESGTNSPHFHDTRTFNAASQVGFPNIVPSLAMLGLAPITVPRVVVDDSLGVISLTTHSGTTKLYPINKLQQLNINDVVARHKSSTPPTPTQLNDLWFNTTNQQLYQLDVKYFSASQPVDPTRGDVWYDPTTSTASVYNNAVWTQIATHLMWARLSATAVIADVVLQLELDLYNRATEMQPQLINWSAITQANQQTHSISARAFDTQTKLNSKNIDNTNVLTRSYVQTKAFTWWYGNVLQSAINLPHPTLSGVWAPSALEIYSKLYGTPYPHMEPWCIQGYTTKPDWWDVEYRDVTRTRRWTPLMWHNIQNGIVPTSYSLPSGLNSQGMLAEVRPCARTSVNISNITTSDKFKPDDLLPPYWNPITPSDAPAGGQQLLTNSLALGTTTPPTVGSYGLSTVGEFVWRQSIDATRASINAAHSIDPLGLYQMITHKNSIVINELILNSETSNVHSQLDSLQGDDLYYDSSVLSLIVLFSRYHNLLNVNDSPLVAWKTWSTKLAYQTGSIIVPQTLRIYEDCVPFENYKIVLKKTENVKTIPFSNLIVTLSQPGSPLTIPGGAGEDWMYRIDTAESTVEQRRMYSSLHRELQWNPTTLVFEYLGTLPWLVGEGVTAVTPDGLSRECYVRNLPSLVVGVSRMQLCSSASEARSSTGDVIGYGPAPITVTVKSVESTFTTGGTRYPRTWEYLTPDRLDIKQFTFPVVVTGIQNLVNFFHNYIRFMEDDGVVFAHGDSPYYDPDTAELVDWNQQIRKFINTVYNSNGLSNRRYVPEPSYATRRAVETPYVELNAFRDRVWINTPEGVVCNVYNTPYTTEIQSTACVFDDLGEPISNAIVPLRTDRMTTLFFENTVRVGNAVPNQNKFQHIGSGKVSLDYYEHVLLFDQQVVDGLVVYDRFLNIQKPTMRLEFQRSIQHFFRPVLGGFVVTPTETLPNFETTAEYQRHDWNVNNSNELIRSTAATREGLGKMPLEYFQNIPVTSKTEFQFWQKMIRHKGTKGVNDVFTKHILYDDSDIDEYWAWKLGTFGAQSARAQVSFNLTSDDLLNDFCNFRFSTG